MAAARVLADVAFAKPSGDRLFTIASALAGSTISGNGLSVVSICTLSPSFANLYTNTKVEWLISTTLVTRTAGIPFKALPPKTSFLQIEKPASNADAVDTHTARHPNKSKRLRLFMAPRFCSVVVASGDLDCP